MMTKIAGLASRLRRDDRGVAAVEFVIVAPVLMLVLAGAADIGLAVMARMHVNEGVSAAANTALVSGPALSASNVDATATTIATVLRRTRGLAGNEATYRITVNGSRIYDFVGGKGKAAGAAASVDECRCPTLNDGIVAWGGKVDCNTPCPNRSLAGRYVSIDVNRPYTPLFAHYGFISDGGIHVRTLALVQ